jgi:molybdopterin/thiamine biosynthesis adenylyltransferase/rhodanese-related sulfurtransferase
VRYARQTILNEVGSSGQKALASAKVLIVGVGGLGSPVSLYLAAAGIGELGLVDGDHVSLSNLARQILFASDEAGLLKTNAARERLMRLNPDCQVRTYPEYLSEANALRIAEPYDIIVDASDNFETKYLLNDLAVKLGKPLVYGAILRWQGQAAVFWASHGPCYRCLFPKPPEDYVPNCAEAGVLGALAGVIGSLQAVEVLKLALAKSDQGWQLDESLIGRFMTFDAKTFQQKIMRLPKDPDCPACSIRPEDLRLPVTKVAISCAAGAFDHENWQDYEFIDVREADEWARGYIPDATLWPLSRMKQGHFPEQNIKRPTILYCQSGFRSQLAMNYVRDAGWDLSSVQDLPGGFAAWVGPVAQDT